ncbi:MAG TPA: hypothetical protein PLP49_05430 [Anaerohalosphaeraceae bacterium]|nr:hypothetical protein [Anaerohalosphaeraceae bacterium]
MGAIWSGILAAKIEQRKGCSQWDLMTEIYYYCFRDYSPTRPDTSTG